MQQQRQHRWGIAHIYASYNNTIITVADGAGNVLAWASAGSLGFAGPKKATPFASSKVVAAITEKLKNKTLKNASKINEQGTDCPASSLRMQFRFGVVQPLRGDGLLRKCVEALLKFA